MQRILVYDPPGFTKKGMENIFDLDFEEVATKDRPIVDIEEINRKKAQQQNDMKARRKAKELAREKIVKATHVAWWSGLTEEEKVTYRETKKLELEQGEARLREAMQHGVNVCIDLCWDHEHSSRERKSMWKQLSLTYAALKRAPSTVHLHITSLVADSETAKGLETQGVRSWLVSTHEESPWDIFDPSRIVILSPDAEYALEDVSDEKVYVIGAIVDRTVRKSRTKDTADEMGIEVRRLPIQELIPNRQTHVLNIDCVVRILCDYSHSRSWFDAISTNMPARRLDKDRKSKSDRGATALSGSGDSTGDCPLERGGEGGEEEEEGEDDDEEEEKEEEEEQ